MLKFLCASDKSAPKLNNALVDYAAQIIYGKKNGFGPCGSMGIFKNEKLIAAIIFHNWIPENGVIEISAAASSPAWLTKRSIREIMAIVFDQHKCQQLVSRMAEDNKRAIQIYKFLGFQSILLPNMRGSGKHELLMLLTKDQWKANKLNEDNDEQATAINS